jgi:hypothetical protein
LRSAGTGAALSSFEGFLHLTDVESSQRRFRDDIVEAWIEVWNGRIDLPTTTGLGYSINHAKVSQYAIQRRVFFVREGKCLAFQDVFFFNG